VSLRSEHTRRILSVLSHAPKTVTQISQDTALPLSHTSRALSRMRSAGLVRGDGRDGERGAHQHILPLGEDELRNDALFRLRTLMDHHPRPIDADFVILERFGRWLRLAWFVPFGQRLVAFSPSKFSKGNEGVGGEPYWLEDASQEEQWWSIDSGESAPSPENSLLGRFDQWPVVRLGIARLNEGSFDLEHPFQYFQTSITSARMIAPGLSHGDWTLSTSSEQVIIRPSRPVTAIGSIKPLRQHGLLAIAGDGALQITDGPNQQRQHLPVSLLRQWWPLRFPRSSGLDAISDGELESILSGDLPKSDPTTRRRLRRWLSGVSDAFGEVRWADDISLPEKIHVRTTEALRACLAHADTSQRRCVVHLEHLSPSVDMLVGQSPVRLLLSMKEMDCHDVDVLTISEYEGGDLALSSGNLLYPVPIEINSSSTLDHSSTFHWNPFGIDEKLLQNLHYFSMHPPTHLQRIAFTEHLQDDAWANRHESIDPLASWIASSSEMRADRWVRIAHSLPEVWHNLLDINSIDQIVLAEAAIHSGSGKFGRLLERRWIRSLEDDIAPLAHVEEALHRFENKIASRAAALILSNWSYLEQYCGRELWHRSLDAWLNEPEVRFVEVLESLEKQKPGEEDIGLVLQRMRMNNQGPLTRGFLDMLDLIDVSRVPMPEECMGGIALLPPHWWAFEMHEWFRHWVDHRQDTMFTLDVVSWPSSLLWLKGEKCGLPLRPERQHPGVDAVTFESLGNWVNTLTESLNEGLLDALDAVSSPTSFQIGRTHLDVSALLRDDSEDFSLDHFGDASINERLLRRLTGSNR